jgi:hypothetical protein
MFLYCGEFMSNFRSRSYTQRGCYIFGLRLLLNLLFANALLTREEVSGLKFVTIIVPFILFLEEFVCRFGDIFLFFGV